MIKIGSIVKYDNKDYNVTAIGNWGIRIERGFMHSLSILVVQPYEVTLVEY